MAECWHVIHEGTLLDLLRRAHGGEDPDMVYAEQYANADTERQ